MIPLYKVHVPRGVLPEIEALLLGGQLANGPSVSAFEAKLGSYLGNPLTIATGDSSTSISLALMLAGVQPGDEVVISPMVCLATSCPIANQYAKVRWCDIDATTGNLDPLKLEEVINHRTKAILVYHWAGNPADMLPIQGIAKKYGIHVIEDAGESIGATYNGARIGNLGSDYTVFSFYPNRHITTIEGGAITFGCQADFERGRWLRRFGIHQPSFRLDDGEINPESDIRQAGLNSTMNQVEATIGLRQLEALPDILARHQENGDYYTRTLSAIPEVQILRLPMGARSAHWVYTILAEDRDALKAYLQIRGIQSSKVHLRNDHYSCFGETQGGFPGVEEFSRRVLSIPCGWWVSPEDAQYISQCIGEFYNERRVY